LLPQFFAPFLLHFYSHNIAKEDNEKQKEFENRRRAGVCMEKK